jgi:peptidyl-prolyl cis-trans isomerase A (cyclophilin A)
MKYTTTILALVASLSFAEEPAKAARPTEQLLMKTNHGDVTIELNREKAPVTVENFLSYVNKKHFDGTVFHRVIADFMIQGGGFEMKDDAIVQKPTGKGIINEAKNGLKNDLGTIAMARTGDPNSATAQFFINVKNNEMLNAPNPDGHGYAVFGKVIKGMDVVEKIKKVETAQKPLTMLHPVSGEKIVSPAGDVPIEAVKIISISVVEKDAVDK